MADVKRLYTVIWLIISLFFGIQGASHQNHYVIYSNEDYVQEASNTVGASGHVPTTSLSGPNNSFAITDVREPETKILSGTVKDVTDSYGNPVTPYSIVHDGDQLNPSTSHSSGSNVLPTVEPSSNYHFALPSYADGITQLLGPYKPRTQVAIPNLDFLPPTISSIDARNGTSHRTYPGIEAPGFENGRIAVIASVQTQEAFNYRDSFSSSIPNGGGQRVTQTASNDYFEHHASAESTGNNRAPQHVSHSFQLNNSSYNVAASPAYVGHPPTENSLKQSSIPSVPAVPIAHTITATALPSFVQTPTVASSIPQQQEWKYTGGFGGAQGVLGNQLRPGYAVKPNRPQSPQILHNDHSLSQSDVRPNQNSFKVPIPPLLSVPITPVFASGNPPNNQFNSQSIVPPSQEVFIAPPLPMSSVPGVAPVAATPTPTSSTAQQTKPDLNINPFLNSLIHNSEGVENPPKDFGVQPLQLKPVVANHLSNRIDLDNYAIGKYTGSFGGPPGFLSPYDSSRGRPGINYSQGSSGHHA